MFSIHLECRQRVGVPDGSDSLSRTKGCIMSVLWQVRIIVVFGALCFLGASYKLFDLMQWEVRKVEAKGTITAIEGYSAEQEPVAGRRKCNGWQTLHYRYTGPDGTTHQGKESLWWGDCRHRTGLPLIVYFDRNDPAQSITRTGFEGRRHWAIMLGMLSFLGLLIGGYFLRMGGSRIRSTRCRHAHLN